MVGSPISENISADYKVILVQEGKAVIEEIAAQHPDLVIFNRLEECETIRDQWPNIAIIILSAESHEKIIVRALDLGADDYILKPYSFIEVEARIRALLRRGSRETRQAQEPDHLQSEDEYLSLHKPDRSASVGGNRIAFTPTEFAVLWELLLHRGKVLTHQTLLQAVWGPEYADESDYLRVYVRQIRRKIEVILKTPLSSYRAWGWLRFS